MNRHLCVLKLEDTHIKQTLTPGLPLKALCAIQALSLMRELRIALDSG